METLSVIWLLDIQALICGAVPNETVHEALSLVFL